MILYLLCYNYNIYMPEIANNKQAYLDYEVMETYEAGIVLEGQEVKSAKESHVSLKGAFVTFKFGKKSPEAFVTNMHISPYPKAGPMFSYDPTRPRKLLLKRKELIYIYSKMQEKGLTIIPLKVYTKANRIKLEIGLCRGRKKYEKKEVIKKREVERQMREDMKIRS